MNDQAIELNEIIKRDNSIIFDLLSEKGKAIFFPKKGILGQSAEAKGKKYNATIGLATLDDGSPMRLPCIEKNIPLDPKEIFPYSPSYGNMELRQLWQQKIKEKNPSLSGEISLPVATNALTHGLSMVAYLFLNPGEKVIVTDKYWGNYNLLFKNAYGTEFTTFNTFTETGFDIASFETALKESSENKKTILLNFPNNPAGYTPTDEEVEKIVEIIKTDAEAGNKIIVIIDDAYFGLVFKDGVYKESIFAKLADLHENIFAIKIDGATKEDYVWGLRIGFITYASKGATQETYTALADKTGGAVRGNISNISTLSQNLFLKALSSPTYEEEKKENYDILRERCEEVEQVLKDDKFKEHFKALPFNSGYFMCIQLNEGLGGEAVRKTLLEKYDTGVIAMKNVLRIAFSCLPKDNIMQVFDNIYNACKDQGGN